MDYKATIEYLFNRLPLFQQQGASAYKEGLSNTLALDAHFHHPHRKYKTIHVGGTNGKGSCAHTLAAVLQSAGYRVGLYTSPHLVDFRERIRVDGIPMEEDFVVRFVERERNFFEPLEASFFEVTTAMAFLYFAEKKVDVAVVEVGLGGRLDCTNIIRPVLSVLTNISLDHTKLLGNTFTDIAGEKAGIIKENIPVVVGEVTDETRLVFSAEAERQHAPLVLAEDSPMLVSSVPVPEGGYEYRAISPFAPDPDRVMIYDNPYWSQQPPYAEPIVFRGELGGYCQPHNTETILHALSVLYRQGFRLTVEALQKGFASVTSLTHLHGRWERLSIGAPCPLYCDTGHNPGGMAYIAEQLSKQPCDTLRVVVGMVNDKDVNAVLRLLPPDGIYYFTQPAIHRAIPHEEFASLAMAAGLQGKSYPTVAEAVRAAIRDSGRNDFIFVGGSSFVVADLLASDLCPGLE